MKSILIYSGKGGVGKTTITYSLAKAGYESGNTIVVLDMDLNTPSMHLFKDEKFEIISNGNNSGIYLSKATINLFIKNAIKKIQTINPDILLIDTPPSITDIHLSIIDKLNISSVVLVSQPTELSKSDIERTIPFWMDKGIDILGVVENMVRTETMDYMFDKLCTIPLESSLDSSLVYNNNKKIFKKVFNELLSDKVKNSEQEIKRKIIFNENIEWEDVASMYNLTENDLNYKSRDIPLKDLKFVNLKTWKKLREAYMSFDVWNLKDVYTESTFEKVSRLVEAFRENDEAPFLLVRGVSVAINQMGEAITLLPGEIGKCLLYQSDELGNIPMVSYLTGKGVVNLFAHEVIPADTIDIESSILHGAKYSKDGRLIPSEETLTEIYSIYGKDIQMKSNYKEIRKQILEL